MTKKNYLSGRFKASTAPSISHRRLFVWKSVRCPACNERCIGTCAVDEYSSFQPGKVGPIFPGRTGTPVLLPDGVHPMWGYCDGCGRPWYAPVSVNNGEIDVYVSANGGR